MFIWPYVGHVFKGRKVRVSVRVSCVTFTCSSLLLLSSRVFVGKTNTSTLFVAEVFASKANTSNLLVLVVELCACVCACKVCACACIFLYLISVFACKANTHFKQPLIFVRCTYVWVCVWACVWLHVYIVVVFVCKTNTQLY